MCRLFLGAFLLVLVVVFSNALRIEEIPEYVEDIPEYVKDIPEFVENIPEYVEDKPEQNSVVGHHYQVPAGGSLMLYSLQALLETEDGSDS